MKRISGAPFFRSVGNIRRLATFSEKFSELKTLTNNAESFLQQLDMFCKEAKFDEAYKTLDKFWLDNNLNSFQKGVYPYIRGKISQHKLASTGELDKIFETDPFHKIPSQNRGCK